MSVEKLFAFRPKDIEETGVDPQTVYNAMKFTGGDTGFPYGVDTPEIVMKAMDVNPPLFKDETFIRSLAIRIFYDRLKSTVKTVGPIMTAINLAVADETFVKAEKTEQYKNSVSAKMINIFAKLVIEKITTMEYTLSKYFKYKDRCRKIVVYTLLMAYAVMPKENRFIHMLSQIDLKDALVEGAEPSHFFKDILLCLGILGPNTNNPLANTIAYTSVYANGIMVGPFQPDMKSPVVTKTRTQIAIGMMIYINELASMNPEVASVFYQKYTNAVGQIYDATKAIVREDNMIVIPLYEELKKEAEKAAADGTTKFSYVLSVVQ